VFLKHTNLNCVSLAEKCGYCFGAMGESSLGVLIHFLIIYIICENFIVME